MKPLPSKDSPEEAFTKSLPYNNEDKIAVLPFFILHTFLCGSAREKNLQADLVQFNLYQLNLTPREIRGPLLIYS